MMGTRCFMTSFALSASCLRLKAIFTNGICQRLLEAIFLRSKSPTTAFDLLSLARLGGGHRPPPPSPRSTAMSQISWCLRMTISCSLLAKKMAPLVVLQSLSSLPRIGRCMTLITHWLSCNLTSSTRSAQYTGRNSLTFWPKGPPHSMTTET